MTRLFVLFALLMLSGCVARPPAVDAGFAAVAAVANGEPAATAADYQRALYDYRHDRDYTCRQPLYAAFFRRQGEVAAHPAAACTGALPFAVQSPEDGVKIVWLAPGRVRAVHLLFAGNSPSPASRFGHVALRLVVCPTPDSSDADCASNLAEHLVLSFQAHVDDYTLNVLKALNGDYPAFLFASRFMDSYEQYAIGEFRELYSLPLRLDDTQRETLVRGLTQVHWGFSGRYDFFTRNCATLLQQALRAIWGEYADETRSNGNLLRPDHLFAALRQSPLADGNALASLPQAEREGFYFASTRPFYESALVEVRQQMPQADFASLDEYLQIAPLSRREHLQAPAYVDLLQRRPRSLEAQLMLEEYALFSSQRWLLGQAADYLRQQDFSARGERLDPVRARVFDECFLQPLRQRNRPARRLTGIPADGDRFADVPAPTVTCASEQGRQQLAEAFVRMGDDGSPQWQQLMRLVRYRADTLDNILQLRALRR